MDVTRNWRLKLTRSEMLAVRTPEGEVRLPEQSGVKPLSEPELYSYPDPKPAIRVQLPTPESRELIAAEISPIVSRERSY